MLTQKSKRVRRIVKLIKTKYKIDLLEAPCFSCPIEKKGFPCSNPNTCELLTKWMKKVGEKHN